MVPLFLAGPPQEGGDREDREEAVGLQGPAAAGGGERAEQALQGTQGNRVEVNLIHYPIQWTFSTCMYICGHHWSQEYVSSLQRCQRLICTKVKSILFGPQKLFWLEKFHCRPFTIIRNCGVIGGKSEALIRI